MRAAAFVLTVLGGVLPVAAVLRAGFVTRRLWRKLDTDLSSIAAIAWMEEGVEKGVSGGLKPEAVRRLQDAILPQSTTYLDVSYMKELIQRAILRAALDDLLGPAIFAGLGALAGMAGSLLSLYV